MESRRRSRIPASLYRCLFLVAQRVDALCQHIQSLLMRLRVLVAGIHPGEQFVVAWQVTDHMILETGRCTETRPFQHDPRVG